MLFHLSTRLTKALPKEIHCDRAGKGASWRSRARTQEPEFAPFAFRVRTSLEPNTTDAFS